MAKWVAALMAFWFSFALIGGVMDGQILGGESAHEADSEAYEGDYGTLTLVSQVNLLTNPFSGSGLNPIAWFSAGINYLKGWAGVFTLNFSFFEDAQIIRYGLLAILAVPILAEMTSRILGR